VGRTPASRRGIAEIADAAVPGPTAEALLAVGERLARILDVVARREGSLSLSQYQLLALLLAAEPEPCEPWELGRGLGSGSAHVTMLLDQLERAGLARREPHGRDRRRRWVRLTDEGRERTRQVGARLATVEAGLLRSALRAEDQRALARLLGRLRAALEEVGPGDPLPFEGDPGRLPPPGARRGRGQ
jgi:DNA-binding MarR family transcriptional regulator